MTKLLATDGEGERLDRFELIAELASGGMATVYLARLSGVAGFQRLVAIKRLHPHLAREPEFIEMFLDEARLAARIHHPNVVPIQEVGEKDGGYYLVMDYVEGDTLARLLARAAQAKQQVPYGVVIRIVLDVLAGLHAAHELKDDLGAPLSIVHRDVSPQNVLVGVDGIARVVDFGVARASSRLSTTRSGQLKGKLAYMAPEQARGGAIDRRADLFSCGIVLWEALALKRLFKGDGEAETLNRMLYDPIAPPSSARPDVPRALEDVCMKALERDVDKRFATAQEFAEALERAGQSLACIGSVRDVAACLEQVVGADLSQQRDAVRAWLSRSEPSQGGRPKPPLDSIVTRVEGREGSASRRGPLPSGVRVGSAPGASGLAGDRVSAPPSDPGSRPGVDRFAVTAPAPAEPLLGAPERDKVSSVSSAILQAPASEPGGAPAAQPARAPRLALGALAVALLLGAGAWGATRWRTAAAPPPAVAQPEPPPAISEPPPANTAPAPAPAPSPTAPATAEALPAASAEPAPSVGAARPAGAATSKRPPARPPTKPPGTSTTKLPDDLSNNPYR